MKEFQEEFVYDGSCRAETASPTGEFAGKAKVTVSDTGHILVEMDVQEARPSEPPGGWFAFFRCVREESKPHLVVHGFGGAEPNPFISAKVDTDGGTVVSTTPINVYRANCDNDLMNRLPLSQLTLEPPQVLFESNGSTQPPKYWIMALRNFVPDGIFGGYDVSELERHPLYQGKAATYIPFMCSNELGFVAIPEQGLSRIKQLRKGELDGAITAYAVGTLPDSRWNILINPESLLTLLSIINASRIRAPFVELRDEGGSVTHRLHTRPRNERMYRVHDLIQPWFVSHLMERILDSSPQVDDELIAACHRLVSSFEKVSPMNAAFVEVCAALDGLARRVGIFDRSEAECFSEVTRARVLDIIHQAAKDLRAVASDAKQPLSSKEKSTILSISERVRGAMGRRGDFGSKISRLMDYYGFEDLHRFGDVFQSEFGRPWEQSVSHFRTFSVHNNPLKDLGDASWEMLKVLRHLQDIAIRVILSSIGYAGQYSPPTLTGPTLAKLDWVKDAHPGSLGFTKNRR